MDYRNRLVGAGISGKKRSELIVEMVVGGRVGDGNEKVRCTYDMSVLLKR